MEKQNGKVSFANVVLLEIFRNLNLEMGFEY
jgi:hypothetical protein